MCIEKTTSYRYNGVLYTDEIDAVKAALEHIALRIIKDHAHNPVKGLLANPLKLSKLLERYGTLSAAPTATEVASEKGQRGPKRTGNRPRNPLRPGIVKTYKVKGNLRAQDYLKECGFADIADFAERAPIAQARQMAKLLWPPILDSSDGGQA